jgi:DNA-binding NarL/FixJ family response regulator
VPTVKIIIADPQYLTRIGFLRLFSERPHLHVLGEAHDSADLRSLVAQHSPDVVVMDLHKGDVFCPEDIKAVRAACPHTRILLVTDDDRKPHIFQALESGVSSILTKNCSQDEIISAVVATARDEKFFCNKVLDILLEKHFPKNEEDPSCAPTSLSAREVEIVGLIAQGIVTRDIADRLCLSPHTVYTHRKNIMKKLQINSVSELVLYAVNAGIVKMGEN